MQAFSATSTLDCGVVAGCDKSDTIMCKAKGNDGVVDSNTVTSTGIAVGNSAPIVTSASLTPATADTNTLFTCTGAGKNDIDGDTLTEQYEFSDANGVLQVFSVTNTFNCAATGCDKNDAVKCKYKVNDGTIDSSVATSTTVNVENTAPAMNAISAQTTDEDTQKTFDLSTVASDVDNDALTYSITAEDAAKVDCSINANNLVMQPALNYNGAASCDVRASDGTANSNTQTVSITVNAVNDAPTLSALSDKTYDEDSGLQNDIFDLHILAADVETAANGLTYSIQSQSNAAAVNCVIDNNQFIDCTTQTNQNGASDVTVRVTDPQNAFAERTFRVTITAVNDAPTVASGNLSPATADTNTAFTCTGVGKADVDNTPQQLTELYQFEDDSGVLQAFSATNTYSCATAGCDKNDNIKCKYKVNDGLDDSNIVTSNQVTVQNTAPTVASASLIPTTANTNTLFTCAGSGSNDADGDSLSNLYQFKDAASILQTFSTTSVFNCGNIAGCDVGDTITCEYKVQDTSNEDSNVVSSSSVNVVDVPDLAIADYYVLPNPANTNSFTLVFFKILNIGTAIAQNIEYIIDYQDGTLSQVQPLNLDPGKNITVSRQVKFINPGLHNIIVTVDQNKIIPEVLETNNEETKQVNVN
ncbi:cadherin-like domain-containing protein [Candidatus Woesearchaeota archaeon]|nr:cadherin-like domain-containing protein [Candidatus Woesearchaeota archaeon]